MWFLTGGGRLQKVVAMRELTITILGDKLILVIYKEINCSICRL